MTDVAATETKGQRQMTSHTGQLVDLFFYSRQVCTEYRLHEDTYMFVPTLHTHTHTHTHTNSQVLVDLPPAMLTGFQVLLVQFVVLKLQSHAQSPVWSLTTKVKVKSIGITEKFRILKHPHVNIS